VPFPTSSERVELAQEYWTSQGRVPTPFFAP